MRIFWTSFLGATLFAGNLAVDTSFRFNPLPDDLDFFLQTPSWCDFDAKGNCYVLDFSANVVFVWHADGTFDKTIGKPGEGPGELSFNGRMGGPQGYLGINGDKLYVFNGGKRNIVVFGLDGSYKDTITFELRAGRTGSLFVTPNDEFLLYQQSFIRDTPSRDILLVSKDGTKSETLVSIDDKSFRREGEPGSRPTAIYIQAYSPTLIMSYNAADNRIITADTGKPQFETGVLGGKMETIQVAIPQRDVEKDDIFEFNEQPFIKNSTFFKTEFGEKMPFFSAILQLGPHYLLYHESPFNKKVDGYLATNKGKLLGRVQVTLGQGGGLMGARGRILGVIVDDEGEMSIAELTIAAES
ncbi:MAG: 6-bladed beta-propeller [Acidobacteria bacterium]|nr:6-bladed beta-propeller [Acidobacteriota bacterium]